MKGKFPDVPRDARHAASQGFDFGEAGLAVEDDFTDGSKMTRRGVMEVSDGRGVTIEVPFTAEFKFGKPVPARKSEAT
jgi:hypothetical protein